MKPAEEIIINKTKISINSPVYFIADIAANHNGSLEAAKELIYKAKEAGADCAKFQHFIAGKIVSDFGFKSMQGSQSHQSSWKKSVYEIYKDYECKREWTQELIKTAKDADIEFMTTPYDFEAIEELNNFVNAYKIGSGDITWTQFITHIAKLGKPVLLATGAAGINDVKRAVSAVLPFNKQLVLMQCNTNYTADTENYKYLNLNVLKTFAREYPGAVLGLSDHSFGHSAVLGAVTLGARVIEKHFTTDNTKIGPDHHFAMNPKTWKEMVQASRELEYALGDGVKRVEQNESETVVIQRRSLRLVKDLPKGATLKREDLVALRPAPADALPPYELENTLGKTLAKNKQAGDYISKEDLI